VESEEKINVVWGKETKRDIPAHAGRRRGRHGAGARERVDAACESRAVLA